MSGPEPCCLVLQSYGTFAITPFAGILMFCYALSFVLSLMLL